MRRRSDDERILRACYRHNQSNDPHYADSQLVHQLRENAWIPQGDGTFVRPAQASTDLLPEGVRHQFGLALARCDPLRHGNRSARPTASQGCGVGHGAWLFRRGRASGREAVRRTRSRCPTAHSRGARELDRPAAAHAPRPGAKGRVGSGGRPESAGANDRETFAVGFRRPRCYQEGKVRSPTSAISTPTPMA